MGKKGKKKGITIVTREIFSKEGEVIGIARVHLKSFDWFVSWCKERGLFVPKEPSDNHPFCIVREWVMPAFFRANSVEKVCDVILMAKTFGCCYDLGLAIAKIRKLFLHHTEVKKENGDIIIHWAKEFLLLNPSCDEAEAIIAFVEGDLGANLKLSKICARANREKLHAKLSH